MTQLLALDRIKEVIEKKIYSPGLCIIPTSGASEKLIEDEESLLPRKISEQHRIFLETYNGIMLDMLNLYGCGESITKLHIRRMSECQYNAYNDSSMQEDLGPDFKDAIIVGDTPAADLIIETINGEMYMYNFDGSVLEFVGEDFNSFICDFVFGQRAAEFCGEEWLQDLINAGIVKP